MYGVDVDNFYLGTPLDRYEFIQMGLFFSSKHIVKQCNLNAKATGSCVYLEIRKVTHSLPQTGISSTKQLREKLKHAGYCEVAYTPGLW